MPHDSMKRPLKVGDIVTVPFKITALQNGEDACNVTMVSQGPSTEYLPTLTCNTRLVTLSPSELTPGGDIVRGPGEPDAPVVTGHEAANAEAVAKENAEERGEPGNGAG